MHICERVRKKNEDNEKANTNEKEKVERTAEREWGNGCLLMKYYVYHTQTHSHTHSHKSIFMRILYALRIASYIYCVRVICGKQKTIFVWFTFHSTLHRTRTRTHTIA